MNERSFSRPESNTALIVAAGTAIIFTAASALLANGGELPGFTSEQNDIGDLNLNPPAAVESSEQGLVATEMPDVVINYVEV